MGLSIWGKWTKFKGECPRLLVVFPSRVSAGRSRVHCRVRRSCSPSPIAPHCSLSIPTTTPPTPTASPSNYPTTTAIMPAPFPQSPPITAPNAFTRTISSPLAFHQRPSSRSPKYVPLHDRCPSIPPSCRTLPDVNSKAASRHRPMSRTRSFSSKHFLS